MATTSILVIDDSLNARQQVIEILRRQALFTTYFEAGDGIEGFKKALHEQVDLILCDVEMPGMDGFKFLQLMNSREELQDIPVIMVTGREDAEAKIRGLEQGASDYVTKPFDPGELLARVKVQLKIKSLQDRLKNSNQKLLELSNTDPLTGLSNRRSLMKMLEREVERSHRSMARLSLIMLDIDHFKKVNDTYGHQQGDLILKSLGQILKDLLRQYDMAARFGGEEFALVLPETDLSEATGVAERVRQKVAEQVFQGSQTSLQVTVSLGVAAIPHQEIGSPDELIRAADAALYRAKHSGRNRVACS